MKIDNLRALVLDYPIIPNGKKLVEAAKEFKKSKDFNENELDESKHKKIDISSYQEECLNAFGGKSSLDALLSETNIPTLDNYGATIYLIPIKSTIDFEIFPVENVNSGFHILDNLVTPFSQSLSSKKPFFKVGKLNGGDNKNYTFDEIYLMKFCENSPFETNFLVYLQKGYPLKKHGIYNANIENRKTEGENITIYAPIKYTNSLLKEAFLRYGLRKSLITEVMKKIDNDKIVTGMLVPSEENIITPENIIEYNEKFENKEPMQLFESLGNHFKRHEGSFMHNLLKNRFKVGDSFFPSTFKDKVQEGIKHYPKIFGHGSNQINFSGSLEKKESLIGHFFNRGFVIYDNRVLTDYMISESSLERVIEVPFNYWKVQGFSELLNSISLYAYSLHLESIKNNIKNCLGDSGLEEKKLLKLYNSFIHYDISYQSSDPVGIDFESRWREINNVLKTQQRYENLRFHLSSLVEHAKYQVADEQNAITFWQTVMIGVLGVVFGSTATMQIANQQPHAVWYDLKSNWLLPLSFLSISVLILMMLIAYFAKYIKKYFK